jgi:hypothetical protein
MLSRYLLATVAATALLIGEARADSTVAAMTAAGALAGPELFYCVQTAADRNCTATQLKTFVTSSGVVTSVGFSVPASSIFTATGSPVTGAGTLGFTTAGTSGGIPYFSSAAALSSSGVLTANLPVIGGGAGVAPSVGSVSGTTTKFATVNVTTFATGQCVQVDASLNLTTTGSACGTGGGITFPQTVAGTTNSGGIPYFSSATVLSSSAVLTANLPVIGGGAGAAPSVGSVSGNTTKFATVNTTTFTTGQCVQVDASLNLTTTGSACGAGGGGSPGGSTTQVQYNNAGAFGGISNVTTNGTSFTEAALNASSSSSTFILHGSAFASTGININGSGNVVVGGDGGGQSLNINSGIWVRGGNLGIPNIDFMTTGGVSRTSASWWEVGTTNVNGIIEQRYTTIPQTYRVYNTTDTPATNYERGVMDWTTTPNTLIVGTQMLGTGQARPARFGTFIPGFYGFMSYDSGGTQQSIYYNGSQMFAVGSNYSMTVTTNGLFFLGANQDVSISRPAAKVIQFGDTGANVNGWHQWAGETRATANTSITSSTTLVPVTGLTANVQAGRTYGFQAELSGTWAAAGGVRVAIAGTATATNIVYDGWIVDSAANGIKGNAQSAALAGVVANAATTGTAGHVTISGAITVNAAGTLLVQAAQSASSGTSTIILQGSTFFVWDMP